VLVGLALGAVCGLAALTRAELLLLVPGFLIALFVARRGRAWRELLLQGGAVVIGTIVVLAPWVIYNQSRFQRTVFISTNDGITLLGANCDAAYHGSEIGLWVIAPDVCIPSHAPPGDQSVVSADYRHDAFSYMRGHLSRLPVVMAVRFGRTWNLFRPTDMLRVNEREGRPRWATAIGLAVYYPLIAFAVGGVMVLRRRRRFLAPLLVAPVVVTVTTLVFYGQTRIRLPAEPSIVVLAAVAVAVVWSRAPTGSAQPELERDVPGDGADVAGDLPGVAPGQLGRGAGGGAVGGPGEPRPQSSVTSA
jgi:4-amino-4-deoxy-L-arabinose transferase-like glycosyltransferase